MTRILLDAPVIALSLSMRRALTPLTELTVSQPIPTRHPVAPGPAKRRKGKRARWEKAR